MHAGIDFEDDVRRIGVDEIDFPVGILLPLDKDIHLNIVYADEVLV